MKTRWFIGLNLTQAENEIFRVHWAWKVDREIRKLQFIHSSVNKSNNFRQIISFNFCELHGNIDTFKDIFFFVCRYGLKILMNLPKASVSVSLRILWNNTMYVSPLLIIFCFRNSKQPLEVTDFQILLTSNVLWVLRTEPSLILHWI